MESLLKVGSIVQSIALCLNTRDYLNFRTINKEVHNEHLNLQFDEEYYSRKLRSMGFDYTGKADEQSEAQLFDAIDLKNLAPVNVFDEIKDFRSGDSLKLYQLVYGMFQCYCDKLYRNKLTNFFPAPYDKDPVFQGKILANIQTYNKSNINDRQYYDEVLMHFKVFKEVFINSCLNEIDLNYSKGNYDTVGTFFNVLLLSDEKNVAVDFFNSKVEYPAVNIPSQNEPLDELQINAVLNPLKDFLNEKIKIIDALFSDRYPMVFTFYENFIQQTLLEVISKLLEMPNECNDDEEIFPVIYFKVIEKLCDELTDSKNGDTVEGAPEDKESFRESIKSLLNVYLEPKILTYLAQSTTQFDKNLKKQFNNFKLEQENRRETELLTNNAMIDLTDANKSDDDNKNNFLNSFTKMFRITNKSNADDQLNSNLDNLVNQNLQNIKNLINLELCYNVVQQTRDRINTFLKFKCVRKLEGIINDKCEEVFKTLINILNEDHVKPAFQRAISLLEAYNSDESNVFTSGELQAKQSVEPLVNFAELINTGDIIVQMISIFYKNEMIGSKIIDSKNQSTKNIWQNQLIQSKKNFETTLDDFVADGLNIGINKLLDQIQFAFDTTQLPTDYYPSPNEAAKDIIPTECARKVVSILLNHCFLLTGATDKGTIDVYQQEIGKRFFKSLVEHIKKQIISTTGAVQLICDINCYYEFISEKLRQKTIVPYFQSLKNVCSLYLIDTKDSKELGRLICDLGKFQGVFTQEEIYEFVQRRQDWIAVKRDVQKVMYGLGLKDCRVM
ncbi:Rcy1p KNAG_0C02120 [Huiozyma naganishii CBS 8797]|uniref:Exocyst complex component Sec10-like alpha-helical bundle domain-containing protein n=1 Tax=Huiozyma naganishii (strain ATCC MYA-139 / BCRC 22969 / CBS 8797 / KCTC 17520 / NBRC 10181 / NCYC 3082 / Yp74L-3) TaxID=1071383 RepID=J7RIG8_HUIN7|nr:hypothetical protein KNAG_0C02120 [Kazachstania naganishii CBS 8797]CCK69323.1 hypothetical protein KNAG_0C02120 [Kazachstania naganishii CBS 8797]